MLLYKMGNFEPVSASGGETVTFENVTAHLCTNLLSDSTATANLTNCLFVCTTNYQPATFHTNACVFLNSDSGVFQTVGAGAHYLADSSPYRGAGTTNIDSKLLSDLRKKTTYPPIVYSGITISSDETFAPQAQRDTGAQCDPGWHYDPLDYVFGGCTANASLTFQEGTAAGWFRNGGGIQMANLKSATFNGTATAPCWWVRYNTMQEQTSSTWSGGSGWGGILGTSAAHNVSLALMVNANFLHCSVLGGEGGYGNHFRDNNGWLIVRSRSSEYGGGSLGGYASSEYLTNCLFERTSVWLDQGQVDIVDVDGRKWWWPPSWPGFRRPLPQPPSRLPVSLSGPNCAQWFTDRTLENGLACCNEQYFVRPRGRQDCEAADVRKKCLDRCQLTDGAGGPRSTIW